MHLTETFGQTVGLNFGFQKCATAVQKRGKPCKASKIELNHGTIDQLNDKYKYLGTFQSTETDMMLTKCCLKEKYYARIKLLCQSFLNSKNLVHALITLAVPILTYAAIVMEWTQEELCEIDRETRKILVENGALHKNSCTYRLYAKRSEGGRGLINIKEIVQKLELNMWRNIAERSKKEPFLALALNLKKGENIMQEKSNIEVHKNKKLHGQYMSTITNAHNAFLWLKNPNISRKIESLIFAAQEQCIKTNYYKAKILKQKVSEMCRLCKCHPETVHHILCNCPVLAKNQYIERHNKIGKQVYHAILKDHKVQLNNSNKEKIPKVFENQDIKLYWDSAVQTQQAITANKPDVIYIHKQQNTCIIIDFSLPWDTRIKEKYDEKISKYLPLANAIKHLWALKKVTIQPIIIGCTGNFTSKMKKEYQNLRLNVSFEKLQSTTFYESYKIIRQVPNID